MSFENQVALITGASNGIGRRLAIDLANKGASVIGCGRAQKRLQETLAEIRRASPSSTVVTCDVGDSEQVRTMVRNVLAEFGKIDVLINNAGIGMRKPFVETSLDTVEEITRVNYLGTVYCTHEVLPSMIAKGSGHIVNISSVAGKLGALNMAPYCASKFALQGLTESLYHELKPLGIDISVICPGPVRTNFNRLFADSQPKAPESIKLSAGAVSAAVIRAIERKQFEVVLPTSLALACLWQRLTPNLFRAVSYRALRWHAGTSR